MEHFFLTIFQAHWNGWARWGILIIFAISFIESLPLLGAVFPGQTLVIFGGFLVKLGVLGFWPALTSASLGAISGDLIGFVLGKRYGGALMQNKLWVIERKHFEATAKLLKDNSIKSIFLGRLNSLTRTLMPFAAGMSDIKAKRFITIDVVTAFIWAFLSLILGFIFGKSFQLAATFIGKFVIMATLITIIIIAALSHMKEDNKKIASLDAVLLGISVSFLYLFMITAENFSSSRLFFILDSRMQYYSLVFRSEILTSVMIFFTYLGGPVSMTSLATILILFLVAKNRWMDAIFSATTLGTGLIWVDIFKAMFQRARPIPQMVSAPGTSFPSGHAMMAAISVIILYYIFLRNIKKDYVRGLSIFLASSVAFAVGASRVYLNVHWASDVLGGFFGGLCWGTLMILLFRLGEKFIKMYKKDKVFPNIPNL